MDYPLAIERLAQGRQFNCTGNTYAGVVCIGWVKPTDAELQAAYAEAVAASTAEESARSAARANFTPGVVATLRSWAQDARSTTATSGNIVNVLNVLLGRLATFFDRFADLLEWFRLK